jgi:hypothetical protein
VNWLVVWVLAVALNAVPAFMPPTWSVLAYFHLYHALPVVPLAVVGALGATTGRAALAMGSCVFGNRFVPASWRANVEALVVTLQSQPTLALPSLALFALGPRCRATICLLRPDWPGHHYRRSWPSSVALALFATCCG